MIEGREKIVEDARVFLASHTTVKRLKRALDDYVTQFQSEGSANLLLVCGLIASAPPGCTATKVCMHAPEFAIDSEWNYTEKVRELWGIPEPPVVHDHNPVNDAISQLYEYQAMQKIFDGDYILQKKA